MPLYIYSGSHRHLMKMVTMGIYHQEPEMQKHQHELIFAAFLNLYATPFPT